MLFTASMGIGLMFFGIAEPVMHYVNPPTGDPQTIQSAQQAMRYLFPLGFSYMGNLPIVGLTLAYFAFPL